MTECAKRWGVVTIDKLCGSAWQNAIESVKAATGVESWEKAEEIATALKIRFDWNGEIN